MEQNPEGLEPQKIQETVVSPEVVSISQEELADLRHKAEVSSQNFERLKKSEQEKDELRAQLSIDLTPSDYDDEKVKKMQVELSEVKEKLTNNEVKEAYPQLKEVWEEFQTFRTDEENKGMSIKTSAKAFLTEKGLLTPKRIGLEKPTGGTRTPVSTKMSNEDIKHLRETNYRKYVEMLSKGLI